MLQYKVIKSLDDLDLLDKKSKKKTLSSKTTLDIDFEDIILKSFSKYSKVKQIKPDSWLLPNRKGYIHTIDKTFRIYRESLKDLESCNKSSSEFSLFSYQKFIRDYLQINSPYRGVLLYHGLGVGKTCSSIAVAEILKSYKKVVVMLPASLKQNYIEELKLCGHRDYKTQQYWKNVPVDTKNTTLLTEISKTRNIPVKVLKENKGIWSTHYNIDKRSNYNNLSEENKTAINLQIEAQIDYNYEFISYNGLQVRHIDSMTKKNTINPFDGKTIIIDEIHNFISRVIGEGKIGKKLYTLLLNAVDVKLIFLSGTPMINRPFEAALLFNLLRGYINVYTYTLNTKIWDSTAVRSLLSDNIHIDTYKVNDNSKTVEITLLPEYYVKVDGDSETSSYVNRNETAYQSTTDILKEIRNNFKTIASDESISIHMTKNTYYALPSDIEGFENLFVDPVTNTIKNPQLFKRRIIGLVSYLKNAGTHLYPTINNIHVLEIPMSDYQFGVYADSRVVERKKENAKRRFSNKNGEDTNQLYKAFSRVNCNFVFPEAITRPYPSRLTLLKYEMDTEDEYGHSEAITGDGDDEANELDIKSELAKRYIQMLNNAMSELEKNPDYLREGIEGLSKYSPKYATMLQNIQSSPGTCLYYSQFRTIEGIGVFSLILKANGYAQFKIKRDSSGDWDIDIASEDVDKPKYAIFTGDKTETKILMNIFNNNFNNLPQRVNDFIVSTKKNNLFGDVVKILMITQSGAEGISLKNVRQVHITEPYWNQIRIDQVIGRAVRTCSHNALPKDMRNVDVFVYLSVFTASQMENRTIKTLDKNVSTDQVIYNIAERKSKIINSLLDTMKDVAIDCHINYNYNKRKESCYNFPIGYSTNDISYVPNIEDEILDIDLHQRQKEVRWRGVLIVINKVKYVQKPGTDELYDYDIYMKEQRPVLVGTINTIKKVEKLEKVEKVEKVENKKNGRVIKFGDSKYIQKIGSNDIYDYIEYINNKKLKMVGKRVGDKIEFYNKDTFEGRVIKIGDIKYIQKKDSNEIYDYTEYKEKKIKKHIGHRDGNKIIFL